jgi:hypothetical protein
MLDSMLGGIEGVGWGALEHAYGPARDVPEMFRDLVHPDDDETRLDGYHQIISALWHQGAIYPATAPAVKFLVEVFASGHCSRLRAGSALALIALATRDRSNSAPVRKSVAAALDAALPALLAARPERSEAEAFELWLFLVSLFPSARKQVVARLRGIDSASADEARDRLAHPAAYSDAEWWQLYEAVATENEDARHLGGRRSNL